MRQVPQPCEGQPRRDAKSHHRAKLKAIVDDLMARFAIFEAEQQPDVTPRRDADGATSTPRPRHPDKGRWPSTPATPEPATMIQEGQDEADEVCLDRSYA